MADNEHDCTYEGTDSLEPQSVYDEAYSVITTLLGVEVAKAIADMIRSSISIALSNSSSDGSDSSDGDSPSISDQIKDITSDITRLASLYWNNCMSDAFTRMVTKMMFIGMTIPPQSMLWGKRSDLLNSMRDDFSKLYLEAIDADESGVPSNPDLNPVNIDIAIDKIMHKPDVNQDYLKLLGTYNSMSEDDSH